jgi:hypothetical protein
MNLIGRDGRTYRQPCTQVANAGCMCSVIVYFLHCICVCDCDSRHESLIMLSPSVMVRRSHLLARCYLGTMLSWHDVYVHDKDDSVVSTPVNVKTTL